MKSRTCLLAVPLLTLTLPAQRPQVGPNDAYVTTRQHTQVARTLNLGAVTNLLIGRCSGLATEDLLGLAGGSPLIWTHPSAHRSACQFPDPAGNAVTHVNDLAVLVGRGGAANRDAVALVGSHGLRIWHRAIGAAGFVLQTVPDATFANAMLVAAHRTDPSAIFCLLANGDSIGVSRQNGGSYGPAQDVFAVNDASGSRTQVLAIAAVDWDNDGHADVAALTNDGLVAYTASGNELARSSHPVDPGAYANPTRALTVVRYTNPVLQQQRECIAWLAPLGSRQCVLMRGAEIDSQPTDIVLDHANHLAVSAGDWTEDGEDDLFLTNAANGRVTMLVGAAGLAPWVFSPLLGFDIAIDNGTPDPAPVAVGDLDGDGDGDLFAFAGSGCREVQSNVNTDQFRGNAIDADSWQVTAVSGMAEPITGEITVTAPPVVAGFGTSYEVEATVWEKAAGGSLRPVPESRSYHQTYFDTTRNEVLVTLSFVIDLADLVQGNYVLMVRPVRRDQAGQILQAGKAWLNQMSAIPRNIDGATPIPGIVPVPNLPPVPPVPPLPPV